LLKRRELIASGIVGGMGVAGALLVACRGGSSMPVPQSPPAPTVTAEATPPATTVSAMKSAATASAASAVGKLSLMTDIDTKGMPLLTQVVDNWKQANPSAPVDVQKVTGGDILTKILTEAAGGVLTDVFAIVGQNLPELANRNVTLKLDAYLQQSKYDLSDFLPLPLDRMRWKGATIAMPRGFSNQCVYWNVDLFDKMGVAHPPTDWNASGWDFAQFLETTRKLTKGSGGSAQYGFAVGTDFVGGWGQWILTNGGQILDDALTHCLVSHPPSVEALQFLQDLIVKEKVAPTPAVLTAENAQSLFLTGRLAMLFAPVASTVTYRAARFKWDLAVNPKGKGPRLSTAAAGAYWCGSAQTKQPELTWKLLDFLASRDAENILATTYFPARLSSLEYLANEDPDLPPAHREVGIGGQKLAHAFPATPDYAQLTDLINKQFAYIWDGSSDAATAAGKAVEAVDSYLKSHPQS